MPDETCIGLSGYSSAGAKSAARRAFLALQEKCRLRAALAAIQADLDAMIPTLNANELQELRGLMAGEVQAIDQDAAALRAKIAEEERLSKSTKAMQVQISRSASTILASEVERRISRGIYPSAEALINEAVAAHFGGGR
jgi:hypothetical protein